MPNGKNWVHRARRSNRSDVVLASIIDRRGPENVRTWHSANGCLVGCWQMKNGKTGAVGHDRNGNVIIYQGMGPINGWSNPRRPSLETLRKAIINNTTGDLFWIGEILLCELEKETGYNGGTVQ